MPDNEAKKIATELAREFQVNSAANIQFDRATKIDRVINALHECELLEPAITNFLDRLFRTETTTGLEKISAEQQSSVDTLVKDQFARHIATAFSSFTEIGDLAARNRVIEIIKKNDLSNRVASYYKNGLREYIIEDGMPRAISQLETIDINRIFSPLVKEPNKIRVGNYSHSFGLADMVLLMELGLIEEHIKYKAAFLDPDENLLSKLVMQRLGKCVLSDPSTNTFFGFDTEYQHIALVSYLSNEDKAKDLLRVLSSIDFTDCNSKTSILSQLGTISDEIIYNDESNQKMEALMHKIRSILKTYGSKEHYGMSHNKFQNFIDRIDGAIATTS
ncbi:MAG: hypothetical protein HOA17_02420 [Candidatus Melainabacteria bacterium]|jgi:hypothetical protein|nr:hypothetical protein [Candidatus Melainabacteria bacterium]